MTAACFVFRLVLLNLVLSGHTTIGYESGCRYKSSTGNFYCRNITELPKEIHENATALRIENSKLNSSSFENLVLPANVKLIDIHASSLKGLAFENMDLPDSVTHIRIRRSDIENIGVFRPNVKLSILEISENIVKTRIEAGAFDNLYSLVYLVLDRNKLNSFPVFKHAQLKTLHLKGNFIQQLKPENFEKIPKLQNLYLMNNKITFLQNNVFSRKNSGIKLINLSDNPIRSIASDAFEGLESLEKLILNDIDIEVLPTNGLQNLKYLSLKGVSKLRRIPEGLNSIEDVLLADDKSFLCCKLFYEERMYDLLGPRTLPPDSADPTVPMTSATTPGSHPPPTTSGNRTVRSQETVPPGFGKRRRRLVKVTLPPLKTHNPSLTFITPEPPKRLRCLPKPTAFQPCENIMGSDWLTAVSFIVAPFALCGNIVVIVVFLCLARNYNVSRFLVTNLAIADMCMGIYLLSLVVQSVITTGEYYEHAESFQFGLSCKVLGFLAMFSSELSVFTLTLITVERYMTIVYALYPKRRLSMRTAMVTMAVGWAIAITIGVLPILGVGSYGKVAICLPFETENGGQLYLLFVFGINGVSFIFISVLYAQIYRSVFRANNSTPSRGHDSRVARRMAVLVFTDFACFAPIAVTGLSALLGHPLIDVKQSKYLLVFFFPLNGLLNPFLYAIITKTFRRDLAALLKNCFVCGGALTNYLSHFPARSLQSTNDALTRSTRPSLDFNAMDFHSLGNIRGSRENPISVSFSKSEPNLVKFNQEH